jgi:hypothetical protein
MAGSLVEPQGRPSPPAPSPVASSQDLFLGCSYCCPSLGRPPVPGVHGRQFNPTDARARRVRFVDSSCPDLGTGRATSGASSTPIGHGSATSAGRHSGLGKLRQALIASVRDDQSVSARSEPGFHRICALCDLSYPGTASCRISRRQQSHDAVALLARDPVARSQWRLAAPYCVRGETLITRS